MLNFEQAMEAAKAGKYLRLIDDGKGFVLPGIIYAMPLECVHAAVSMLIEGTDLELTKAQLLLINVFRTSDKECCARFFASTLFSPTSIWQLAEPDEVLGTEHMPKPEPQILPFMIKSSDIKS